MMKPLHLLLALLLTLASSAGALKMSIWDRDMQTTLGAGESNGTRFNVQLVKNYSGPVVVLFSQTDDEKRSGNYQGLQNRYDGVLKNGELTLMPLQKDETADPRNPAAPSPSTPPTQASMTPAPTSVGVTLTKLLQPFKLSVIVKTTNQSVTPPENAQRPITTESVPIMTTKSIGAARDNLLPIQVK